MTSFYRQQLEDYLIELDIDADSILDIGGGSYPINEAGVKVEDSDRRLKSLKYKTYHILDNGVEEGLKPTYNHDMNYPIDPPKQYDVVFALEIFECIWNPIVALTNIFDFTKQGGVAYITFPFVYPWYNPKDYDFMRYTRSGVEKLLKEAGFKEWTIIYRIDKSGLLEDFYRADGMHAVKRERHDITGFIVEVKK